MKRTSILALLSALAIPALGDGLKITINPHSETEVAAASAEGFSSVEEWYAHLNRTVDLPMWTQILNQTWASLSPENQRFLRQAETKWERWYNSLPFTTNQDVMQRIGALRKHNSELQAWLPKTEPTPTTKPERPPTIEESGTPSK